MNVNRDTKAVPNAILLPRPWDDPTKAADVTDEERAQLKQDLLARSAFAE